MLSPSQIIVLATPVFLALILLEWAISRRRQRAVYGMADAITSLNLGMLSQTSAVFTKLLTLGLYTAVSTHWALWRNDDFWLSLPGWLLALLFYDFCYYWLHRMGHEVAVLWAAHVVHHQSQAYNLSTALRQTSSGALLSWVFYLPMALAGVPPLVFAVVGLIDLLYQFWVHTEQVQRLGWFDRWFCSPSNHRVHHAVNDAYVDKNYGGILILWDRLFGTFKEEDARDPCVYGTRGLLNSWDPLWANAVVYRQLAHDSWHTRSWRDKCKVWLQPPGWRPADVARRAPKPVFDLEAHRSLFAPVMSRPLRVWAALQFAALLTGSAAFLWQADQAPWLHNLIGFAVLLVGQWALGAAMQGCMHWLLASMLQSGALSMATAALDLQPWHHVFKPLTMLIALVYIAVSARQFMNPGTKDQKTQVWLLAAAIVFSLCGDVFLMLDGLFVPGLLSFLLAHLAYIALFRRNTPWFSNRPALWATAALGAAMVAVLWLGGLPPALRLPVLVYVTVIALMAAQAWGRYRVQGGAPALQVALGASCFLLSDATLAINQFVQPFPYAAVPVLATYYIAQALILHGSVQALTHAPRLAPDSGATIT